MNGEGDVDLTVAFSRDPVRPVAAYHCLVVDRVGVVAEKLARGRDNRREARSLRVPLEKELRALGEQVEDVPKALDRVELIELAFRREHVVVADVGEETDELVERLGRLWGERHDAPSC